ncbi:MAG: methyl-accepting chemotaxis protein, partial [bacterium]
ALAGRVGELSRQMDRTFLSLEASTSGQEEAVEETASLVAHMRSSMGVIGEQVEQLLSASDESASSVLEMSSSIEEVTRNAATLHEVVEASTSSVHEMGASIRQVAEGAEQVQQMAEGTATSVTQMDRSIQEVSSHAHEAAVLTQRAHAGAGSGTDAVHETIRDIERISTLTTEAKERLSGLVSRVSEIGGVLAAIDEINDETNLLSLNAAIIAAQAGEQGKAFLVVANHVKTLARRTAGSTQDIERLIADIELESGGAVRAMEAGIEAVQAGVARSRTAGDALLEIQEACRDASERVDEIARATAEQSRNSKGVAESTQRTSLHIQQITEAMSEQRRASEEMLANAERALESCQHVHRSTEEQRAASRFITEAISGIRDMVRAIGEQTTVHSRASEDVSAAVMALLENAHQSGEILEPIRALIEALKSDAATVRGEEPAPSSGSGGDACGESSGGEGSQGPEIVRPYGPQRAPASGSLASPSSATASPAR